MLLIRRTIGLLLCSLLLLVVGCSDNPVDNSSDFACEHVDAEGLVVEATGPSGSGAVLAGQWKTTVTGGVVLQSGQAGMRLAVSFLDLDSTRIEVSTACVDHALRWTGGDTSIVKLANVPQEKWQLELSPQSPGSTSVRLQVWHGDHSDFTSQPIPVVVTAASAGCDPVAVDGMAIRQGDSVVAGQWVAFTEGGLAVTAGTFTGPLSVHFLALDSTLLELPDSCANFDLVWELDDSTIVDLLPGSSRWQISLSGKQAGATSVRFRLTDAGVPIWSSLPLQVEVNSACDSIPVAGLRLEDSAGVVYLEQAGNSSDTIRLKRDIGSYAVLPVWLDGTNQPIIIDAACVDHFVSPTLSDSSVVDIIQSADSIVLTPLAVGEATMRLRLQRGTFVDYASGEIVVVVEPPVVHTPTSATALGLERHCNLLASWNYDEVNGPNQVRGALVVSVGVSLNDCRAGWLDTLTDSDGLRYEADLSEAGYSLEWTVADPAVATLVAGSGDAMSFAVDGHAMGHTTVVFRLLFDGASEVVSGPIPIIVRDSAMTASDSADYAVVFVGEYLVAVRDGALVPDDTICGGTHFKKLWAREGELTALFGLWEPKTAGNYCDRRHFPISNRQLVFDFADPCVARMVYEPVHWGEDRIFHLKGLSAGHTTVRMHVINVVTKTVEFTSPPLPIEITP